MRNVTAENVLESIQNAWNALIEQYTNCPSEEMRNAINLVGRICAKVKSQMSEKEKGTQGEQISIEEWIEWLNS